jgi:hypothetical protein
LNLEEVQELIVTATQTLDLSFEQALGFVLIHRARG